MNKKIKLPPPPLISLSSSFVSRTRCKYCLSGPVFYFRYSNTKLFKNPRFAFKKQEFYLVKYPITMEPYNEFVKDFKLSNYSKNGVGHSSFNVKLYRTKNTNYSSNDCEVFYCECAMTAWSINLTEKRKEISSRKCSKNYPNMIIY